MILSGAGRALPTILTIDPGDHPGYAIFSDRVLVYAHELCPRLTGVNTCVIEKPQIYRASRSKADPNDLITLAILVGEISATAKAHGISVEFVTPAQWKGQVPKEIGNARTLAKLTDAERAIIPQIPKGRMHNVLDAIGIGLWRAGR